AQIGFRRGLERSYAGLRLQEFAEDAETCFRATGVCCFEAEAIEQQMAEVGDPLERRRGGALCVWLRPEPGREYCVAVDTAGGGEEGDFAAVQVVDSKTGIQCAELQERLRPAELARVSAAIAREYNGALLVVERNNHGSAVLAYLETSERYERVYRQRGEPGWLTTMASKPEMVARMGVLLRDNPLMFLSRRLLGECRTFVAGEHGKMGALRGAHDDLVMAMAIAQTVRAEMMSLWG
ncbi:MAG: terminase, partial [Bryocella sp.]